MFTFLIIVGFATGIYLGLKRKNSHRMITH
jgi:hypothetical protein